MIVYYYASVKSNKETAELRCVVRARVCVCVCVFWCLTYFFQAIIISSEDVV